MKWRYNNKRREFCRLPRNGDTLRGLPNAKPTCFDTTDIGKYLWVSTDKLSLQYSKELASSSDQTDYDSGCVMADAAIPRDTFLYYCEFHIDSKSSDVDVAIGLVENCFQKEILPGFQPYSYGLHALTGRKVSCLSRSTVVTSAEYTSPIKTSVVGMGVKMQSKEIFFTLDGKDLGVAFSNIADVPYYPAVGVRSSMTTVTANFGQERFLFDTSRVKQKELESIIESTNHVSNRTCYSLVQNYLAHSGYIETYRNFSNEIVDESESTSARHEVLLNSLDLRFALKKSLLAGSMTYFDEITKSITARRLDLHFILRLDELRFYAAILVFSQKIKDGVEFDAKDFVAKNLQLPSVKGKKLQMLNALRRDYIELLAYDAREVTEKMGELLCDEQRDVFWDIINSAFIDYEMAKDGTVLKENENANHVLPRANLCKLLSQLVLTNNQLLRYNDSCCSDTVMNILKK